MKNRSTIKEGDGDPRHGTLNGYNNLGCKCPSCKKAKAKHQADYREKYGRRETDYSFEQRRARAKHA